MLIAARNSAGGASLPYDAEVEYLESTGTQWIVLESGITAFEVVFLPSAYKNYGAVIGTQNEHLPYEPCQLRHDNAINSCSVALCTNSWSRVYISDSGFNTLILTKNGASYSLTLNGTVVSAQTGQIAKHPFYLFSANQGNDSTSFMNGKFRVKSCTFYGQSGNHVLIPVRRTVEGVSVGEMFDKVTGTFMERHGTLEIGPDK